MKTVRCPTDNVEMLRQHTVAEDYDFARCSICGRTFYIKDEVLIPSLRNKKEVKRGGQADNSKK